MRRAPSFAVLLSFNELAWLAVFVLLLLYTSAATRTEPPAPPRADPIPPTVPEGVVSQELLGLRGDLQEVVVIVDMSGSMQPHWDHVQRVVRVWLEHLPIARCRLVLFADTVAQYPADGTFAEVRGDSGARGRQLLFEGLANARPAPRGATNLLAALRSAYADPELDTIILFTDGFPDVGNGRFAVRMVREINALADSHRPVVVNAIAVGAYFDRRFARFLMGLAKRTGGGFLGF